MSYRFAIGDPVDMEAMEAESEGKIYISSLNLRELGDPRVDLGIPLSIADVNGCTAIGLGRR